MDAPERLTSRRNRRDAVLHFGRSVLVGITVTALAIAGVVFVFRGNTARDLEQREQTRKAYIAVVCELALPQLPDLGGRDEFRTNTVCLIPNDLPPFDVNGDGTIDQ